MDRFLELPLELREAIYNLVRPGPSIYTFDPEDFYFTALRASGPNLEVCIHLPWLVSNQKDSVLAHVCQESRRFWLAALERARSAVGEAKRNITEYWLFDPEIDTFYVHSRQDLERLESIVRRGAHAKELSRVRRLAVASRCFPALRSRSSGPRMCSLEAAAMSAFRDLTDCYLVRGKTWSTASRALSASPNSAPESVMMPEVRLAFWIKASDTAQDVNSMMAMKRSAKPLRGCYIGFSGSVPGKPRVTLRRLARRLGADVTNAKCRMREAKMLHIPIVSLDWLLVSEEQGVEQIASDFAIDPAMRTEIREGQLAGEATDGAQGSLDDSCAKSTRVTTGADWCRLVPQPQASMPARTSYGRIVVD